MIQQNDGSSSKNNFDFGFAQVETNLSSPVFTSIRTNTLWYYISATWLLEHNTLLAKTQLLDFRLKLWYRSSISKLLILAVACLFGAIKDSARFDLLLSTRPDSHWCTLVMDLTASRGVERFFVGLRRHLVALR